jgi:DNA ligase-1
MTTKEFAIFLEKLEKTQSRLEITAILAKLFKKAKSEEIDKICYLVLGQLAPSFSKIEFNIAEKMMLKIISQAFGKKERRVVDTYKKTGDLGETAVLLRRKSSQKDKPLPIDELYQKLLAIAQEEGEGSQERKIQQMAELLRSVDSRFLKYLVRIPVGKLRLGFSDITILDALSWMKTSDKSLRPQIEAAYNRAADIGKIAKIFKQKDIEGLKRLKLQPGLPIRPALAERLSDPQQIIEKLGKCAIEPKVDGFRVQIHADAQKKEPEKAQKSLLAQEEIFVRIFSRNLENTTEMFPDIVAAVRKIIIDNPKIKNFILDGEAIGIDRKTGRLLPFQETVQRKRKYGIEKLSRKIPLVVFTFDILLYNDQDLLHLPFKKRRKILEKLLKGKGSIKLIRQKIVSDKKQIRREFERAIKKGLEGVMCKKIDSPYQPGARNFNWVKYKRGMKKGLADTIDCLVYRGRGKRAKFGIGAFLVGVYDKQSDQFTTIAKIGTGLTDKQWREMAKRCDTVKTQTRPKNYLVDKNLTPDVWCLPSIVVEIKADEITRSPIHTTAKFKKLAWLKGAGLALRFPRIERIRDKRPQQATTVDEIIELYQLQLQRQ